MYVCIYIYIYIYIYISSPKGGCWAGLPSLGQVVHVDKHLGTNNSNNNSNNNTNNNKLILI